VSFKNSHVVAQPCEIVGRGQTATPAPTTAMRSPHRCRRKHLNIAGFVMQTEVAALGAELAGHKSLSARMDTGLSSDPRRQLASQGAPQTRPQMDARDWLRGDAVSIFVASFRDAFTYRRHRYAPGRRPGT